MGDRPNVVFVVADTLRRDRVSCYGYDRDVTPNLDRFAEEATVYEDAVAQAPWSIPSHASLFTGKYPHEHGATTVAPVLREEVPLAEHLSRHGYRTVAVSANEYVRPLTGLARGFDEFHPASLRLPDRLVDALGRRVNTLCGSPGVRRPVEAAFNAARRLSVGGGGSDAARTPLEPVERVVRDAPEPFFLFVNLIEGHLPRSPDDRFRRRFVADDLADVGVVPDERAHNFRGGEMTARQRRKLSQLYDADVATMDDRLGRLLESLRTAECFGDALVVVVSDHGENLGEFGLVGHQHSVYDSVTAVPLVVKYPEQDDTRTVDEQVEIRRLFHTVLDVAAVGEYPNLSLEQVERSRPSYGEFHTPMLDIQELEHNCQPVYDASLMGRTLSFVRHDGYKLIRNVGEETLYRTPEWAGEVNPERHRATYERLRGQFPDAS